MARVLVVIVDEAHCNGVGLPVCLCGVGEVTASVGLDILILDMPKSAEVEKGHKICFHGS